MPYKTPDTLDGECELSLTISGSPELVGILINKLKELIYVKQWVQQGALIQDCTDKMRLILESAEIICFTPIVDDDGYQLVDDDGFIITE